MKWIKYLLIFILTLFVLGFIAIKAMSEKKPDGESGQKAELLADQVLETLNVEAFDTLKYLQWEFFRPGQKYLWDKQVNKAIIEFDDYKVIMNLNSLEAISYKAGIKLKGSEHEKAKSKAWSNWCNDSFWLIAPFKIKDKGTTRKLVEVDGKSALLVEYESGGVTPGDSYLWLLDDNKRPVGWKMWTKILPVKGIYNEWKNWKTFENVQFADTRSFFGKEVYLKGIKVGKNLSDFGISKDPFENI